MHYIANSKLVKQAGMALLPLDFTRICIIDHTRFTVWADHLPRRPLAPRAAISDKPDGRLPNLGETVLAA